MTLVFLVGVAIFFPLMLDDPYITFRYGRHLAEGLGPTWNPGEPPVEGFTSPAWVLIAAASERAQIPDLLTAKLLGILAGVVALGSIVFGTRRLLPSLLDRAAAALLLAVSLDVVLTSVSGMENVPFMAASALLLPLVGSSRGHASVRRAVGLGVLLASLCWLRPEGHLIALVVLVAGSWEALSERCLTPAAASVLSFSVLVIPLHTWRLITFGELLPLTFYAKHTGAPVATTVRDGVVYLAEKGGPSWALFALALISSLFTPRPARVKTAGGLVAAFLLYSVVVGGDATAFPGFRLALPVFPLVVVLAVAAVSEAVPRPWTRSGALGMLILLFGLMQYPTFLAHWTGLAFQRQPGTVVQDVLGEDVAHFRLLVSPRPLQLSSYIVHETPRGESIAIPWAGRIPYETDVRTIDLLGLNDAHIAKTRKTDKGVDVKYDPAYVLSRRPLFVCENFILSRFTMDRIAKFDDRQLAALGAGRSGQRALLRSPVLLQEYEVDAAAPNTGGGTITCFRRRSASPTAK